MAANLISFERTLVAYDPDYVALSDDADMSTGFLCLSKFDGRPRI